MSYLYSNEYKPSSAATSITSGYGTSSANIRSTSPMQGYQKYAQSSIPSSSAAQQYNYSGSSAAQIRDTTPYKQHSTAYANVVNQRSTSPHLMQHPRYTSSNTSLSSTPINSNKYSVAPAYEGGSATKDQLNYKYLPSSHSNTQTYTRSYQNTQLSSPYLANVSPRPSHTAAEKVPTEGPDFSSYYNKYTSSATASSNQLRSYTNNNNTTPLRYQPQTTATSQQQAYSRSPYHGRAFSNQNQDEYLEERLQRNSRPGSSNGYNDSMSPSKRVTFNLARNTYTDIDQIEKRLTESTRLRLVDDSDDEKPTAINYTPIVNDDRNSVDHLRVGREKEQIAYRTQTAPSLEGTPRKDKGQKLVRNPSRSKSPIKPSLKRTLSYSSPMKGQAGYSVLQQRSDIANESPLTNSTNKMINVNSKEVQQAQGYSQSNVSQFYDENTSSAAAAASLSASSKPTGTGKQAAIDANTSSTAKENRQQVSSANTQDVKAPQNEAPSSQKGKKGVLKYSDGSRYDGEISNNQRHGFGTLMSSEFQVIYQGSWQNDTYHGQGKFFNPMSDNLQEDYNYNDFDIALSKYWESYEGEFYEGKLDGFGTLMLTNGEKLVGNFKQGRISGNGTYYCTKGPAVTAKWDDNRMVEKY